MTQNQLLEEAQALPDLDEYAGLSVVDIAHAIINWPEGSEDQLRAIAAIRARAPGIGHNRPPLAERLDEDFAAMRGRADQIRAVAEKAVIVDQASAEKVLDLLRICNEFDKDIEDKRKDLQRPYNAAIAAIASRAHDIGGRIAPRRRLHGDHDLPEFHRLSQSSGAGARV